MVWKGTNVLGVSDDYLAFWCRFGQGWPQEATRASAKQLWDSHKKTPPINSPLPLPGSPSYNHQLCTTGDHRHRIFPMIMEYKSGTELDQHGLLRPLPCWRSDPWLHHVTFWPTWSKLTPPPSAPAASYDGIDPCYDPAASPTALGVDNNTNGANAASDDNGGNGWIFAHSSITGQLNEHHLLQPFSLWLDRSINGGYCCYHHNGE